MTIPVDVEPAFLANLRAATALTALLGSTRGQPAIFPVGLPSDAALPAIVFQQIALPQGASGMGSDSGLQWPTYQFTVMVPARTAPQQDSSYAVVKAIVKQLRIALERVRGTYSTPGGSVTIQDILHMGGQDMQWPGAQYRGYALDVQVIHV